MDAEEVGLGVKEPSCSDGQVGVEIVFFSKLCEGELVSVAGYPVSKGAHGYFCLVFSTHSSQGHIQGVSHVEVCECREDEFWWVGCMTELAIREALLAVFAEI